MGTYYLSPTETGYYDSIYISEETATKILDDALTKGGYSKDNETTVGKWWSDLSQRTHYVVVDDFENIESVYNALTDMNVCCADDSELGIQDSIVNASNIFSFASVFLIISTVLLSLIMIIQSTANALSLRKSDIGLLKAIGYKNSQIFACIYSIVCFFFLQIYFCFQKTVILIFKFFLCKQKFHRPFVHYQLGNFRNFACNFVFDSNNSSADMSAHSITQAE